MKFCFRVDASSEIGTGHVFRCLTLADALVEEGAVCNFICRPLDGNLVEFISSRGHGVHVMPAPSVGSYATGVSVDGSPAISGPHDGWLGVSQLQDAEESAKILSRLRPDWLIVDHYGIDAQWESRVAAFVQRICAIDDLADRHHACDVLLDQTYGRRPSDYHGRVPPHCRLFCGAQYALLRPQFASQREFSIHRRVGAPICRLFVSMGGVDKNNLTGAVLASLRHASLPSDFEIYVVLGRGNPWRAEVVRESRMLPWAATVVQGISDMAEQMAASDLAVGSAGSSSWERCCLGLPTIMFVEAKNQVTVANVLERAGAAKVISNARTVSEQLPRMLRRLLESPREMEGMIKASAAITDGKGAKRLSAALLGVGSGVN